MSDPQAGAVRRSASLRVVRWVHGNANRGLPPGPRGSAQRLAVGVRQLHVGCREVLPQVPERERARDRQGRRRAAQKPGERDLARRYTVAAAMSASAAKPTPRSGK
jgi:hypothetical protein